MRILTHVLVAVLMVAGCTVASADCAWPNKTNGDSFNVAFPDTASTYWSYPYHLAEGENIELSGKFIKGRYFSFNTYTPLGVSLGGIHDSEITTDATGGWHVRLRAATDITDTVNTMAGTAPGCRSGWGVLIYRVYVPDNPQDEMAGTPLPQIIRHEGNESRELTPCANPGHSLLAEAIIRLFGPRANERVKPEPVFLRPKSDEGFFPNRDIKYLAALTEWEPGRLVVIRGKAPTSPGTRQGAPLTGTTQVRYWSFCTNEYRKPWPVNDCVPDFGVKRNEQGEYVIVVSTPGDRPGNATPENGVTWLDWGENDGIGIILYRHMLPATDFTQTIQRVQPGASGREVMEEYYPEARYCGKADFEKQGAACGKP